MKRPQDSARGSPRASPRGSPEALPEALPRLSQRPAQGVSQRLSRNLPRQSARPANGAQSISIPLLPRKRRTIYLQTPSPLLGPLQGWMRPTTLLKVRNRKFEGRPRKDLRIADFCRFGTTSWPDAPDHPFGGPKSQVCRQAQKGSRNI